VNNSTDLALRSGARSAAELLIRWKYCHITFLRTCRGMSIYSLLRAEYAANFPHNTTSPTFIPQAVSWNHRGQGIGALVLRAIRYRSLVHLPSSHEQPQRAQSVAVQFCHARCQPLPTVPRNRVTTYARPSSSSTIRSTRRNPLSPALNSMRSFTTHDLPTRWPAQPSRPFCRTWPSSRRWWHACPTA
jgi:hypothetical protein